MAWTSRYCDPCRFCPSESFDPEPAGEQWFSCNSKALCAGPCSPCQWSWQSHLACRKCLLLPPEWRPPGCLCGCLLTRPPPASVAASLCFQAVVSQLSAALLHCFRLCFNVLSKCFAWPPHGYLPCFSSVLSSCLVFFWYPFSHVVCPLVLIFCDWGFDTCKVTLRHCLVVDSFLGGKKVSNTLL